MERDGAMTAPESRAVRSCAKLGFALWLLTVVGACLMGGPPGPFFRVPFDLAFGRLFFLADVGPR